MTLIRSFFVFIIIFFLSSAGAQDLTVNDMAFYADVMTNASDAKHRYFAHQRFEDLLDERLARESSFKQAFEDIPWIFVQYDQDSTFRLISWQVEKEDQTFSYFSLYQAGSGYVEKFGFEQSGELKDRTTFGLDDMYSAIFYEIHAFEDYYLLSGYRRLEKGITQKICEVMTIDDLKPSFGKSIFYKDESVPEGRGRKRVILNYSSVSKAQINVNPEDKIIVFDHVISIPDRANEGGLLLVADGSYQAYKHNGKGRWFLNEKLYTDIQETPLNRPLKKIAKNPEGKNR